MGKLGHRFSRKALERSEELSLPNFTRSVMQARRWTARCVSRDWWNAILDSTNQRVEETPISVLKGGELISSAGVQ
jgi:hypothetical protein